MTSLIRIFVFGAVAAVSVCLPASLLAQDRASAGTEFPLYSGAAPGSENWNWQEEAPLNGILKNVVKPSLLYYPADKAKAVGTAMIVAPGGGFSILVMSREGTAMAKRLNEMGIDAFILKYRLVYSLPGKKLPSSRSELGIGQPGTPQEGQNIRSLAAHDGQQAVRWVRQHAADLGIRPDHVGMMGFSAGGYVTFAAVTGPKDSRPDFAAPIYPAVGMPATKELPIQAPESAPPLFLAVAADDKLTGWQGPIEIFTAWRKAGVPAELHIFQVGGHGFANPQGGVAHFMDRLEEWLRLNGYLTKTSS